MIILKRYKDESQTHTTTLGEERYRLECLYDDVDLLIFVGSTFQTNVAYYKVIANHSKDRTID